MNLHSNIKSTSESKDSDVLFFVMDAVKDERIRFLVSS